MGGAVSELRGAIHAHVLIAGQYPLLLEPQLAAVQFFLRTAEAGEGTASDRALDEIPTDVVLTDKKLFEEASTEVELLAENAHVLEVLLHAVASHRSLELAPERDPFVRWYDPPWRRGAKPMPKFVEIGEDEVPRFRVAVLRASVRCLRLLMFASDAKETLESLGGPEILNRAALENPLDDYVKRDVKHIFRAVYGGDNAVRRVAMGDVPVVMEMLVENGESAIVQLAGVQRFCRLLGEAQALFYVPSDGSPTMKTQRTKAKMAAEAESNQSPDETATHDGDDADAAALDTRRLKLFADLETHGAVQWVAETLRRFDVDKFLALYVHVCRFIAFVAVDERNAKLIGQSGGIDGAVRLLLKAREMQREKRFQEKEAAARLAKLEAQAHRDDWSAIMDPTANGAASRASSKKPPPAPLESGEKVASLDSLAVVDFTPTEIGQQAMWALDLLARLDFNVSQMKVHKLKYLLEEIRLDPENHELGSALIITRRLRLIRWDQITGAPPENELAVLSPHKKKATRPQRKI